MKPLEELTVAELKDKAVELGMPREDVEAFRTKAPLIATINTLSAKEAVKEEKVESIEEKPDPAEDKEVNKNWKSKAERMKAHLLAQEYVSLMIPLEVDEKVGVVEWCEQVGNKAAESDPVIPFKEWFALPLEKKMNTYQRHISGGVRTPQLNGYIYMSPAGAYTRVPMQIFEVVNEANMGQSKATQHMNLDRLDPQTRQATGL